MRVLFAEYPLNRWNLGGKERRTRALAAELRTLGVDVGFYDPWTEINTAYDILQIFGSEYYQAELVARAKNAGLKVAVFSILVFPSQTQLTRTRIWRRLDPFVPVTTTYRLRQKVLRDADLIFFSGETERRNAASVFGVQPAFARITPSTVSPTFADADPRLFSDRFGHRDFVLSVGRIEPRKCTLNLIRATRRCRRTLILIGRVDDAFPDFARAVREEVARHDDVILLPPIAPDDPLLASAYAAASVHVLPSLHETAGLVNMEALLAGTNVVTSHDPSIREYMRDFAFYADPTNIGSLSAAIDEAARTPFDEQARQYVLSHLVHPVAARGMLRAYEDLLRTNRTRDTEWMEDRW